MRAPSKIIRVSILALTVSAFVVFGTMLWRTSNPIDIDHLSVLADAPEREPLKETAGSQSPPTEDESVMVPSNDVGRRVHIDPETGGILPRPAGKRAAAFQGGTRGSINSSQQGLREKKSPVVGGGVMVDLQGRFRSTVSVTVDENGAPCLICAADEDPEECSHRSQDSTTVNATGVVVE